MLKNIQQYSDSEDTQIIQINFQDLSFFKIPKEIYLKKSINTPDVKDFFFIRHGSTNWNMEMLLLGPQDLSLNEKGISQVTATVNNKLQHVKFHSIISSHLKRCTETMDIVLQTIKIDPSKIEIDIALEERNFGNWSTYTDSIQQILDSGNKANYKMIPNLIESLLPADAETPTDFDLRIGESLHRHLHSTHPEEIPLIISHGCVKSIITKFMNLNDDFVNYGDSVAFHFTDNGWEMKSMQEYKLTGDNSESQSY